MMLWVTATLGNAILCLLLLFRGHYERYRILFSSLIFELIAAPVLYFSYTRHPGAYYSLYHIKQFVSISFDLGIIFEAWRWRNKWVRRPIEGYLLAKLVAFLAERAQFIAVSDGIHEVLRYSNIAIVLWFMLIFRNPPNYRKEKSYER